MPPPSVRRTPASAAARTRRGAERADCRRDIGGRRIETGAHESARLRRFAVGWAVAIAFPSLDRAKRDAGVAEAKVKAKRDLPQRFGSRQDALRRPVRVARRRHSRYKRAHRSSCCASGAKADRARRRGARSPAPQPFCQPSRALVLILLRRGSSGAKRRPSSRTRNRLDRSLRSIRACSAR